MDSLKVPVFRKNLNVPLGHRERIKLAASKTDALAVLESARKLCPPRYAARCLAAYIKRRFA